MLRVRSYALTGAVLSLGAPLGLALLRAGRGGSFSVLWASREIVADLATYAYVTISTLITFSVFGAIAGGQADKLERLAKVDPLTRLSNRRSIEDRFAEEEARGRRRRQPSALLIVDVDGLKTISDREGHRAGDAALQTVGVIIKEMSRADDLAARWGGDEFLILAPGTGLDQATRLAERIRGAVESRSSGRITLSIGLAALSGESDSGSLSTLFARADEALYEAKQSGRNRVRTAGKT